MNSSFVELTPVTVLFVHQSAEMYGSDKVLLAVVLAAKKAGLVCIVLLPEQGPLLTALENEKIETHVVQITKISRKTLNPGAIFGLPLRLFQSIRQINRIIGGRRVDVVYTNTLAVLSAAVWARLKSVPHLWHVHEILSSPKIVSYGFPRFLQFFADRVVCNSHATRQWLVNGQPKLAKKSTVIWNGQSDRPPVRAADTAALRTSLRMTDSDVLVALVGRIHPQKGHQLLVIAAQHLWERGFKNIFYLIVGGVVPGQEHNLGNLEKIISDSDVKNQIVVRPFCANVWPIWDACDIAVVPSIVVESFGLVAIEAMASSKPVVVAGHGGLTDVVENEVSGLHFRPNDALDLARAIEKLVINRDLMERYGKAGFVRQQNLFSLQAQTDSINRHIYELSGSPVVGGVMSSP
jgi:glycosyltransferase involved in cell wall biosynthesis